MKDELPPLEAFPLKTFDTIRYGDTDLQGHVNNAVYLTYFETGRVDVVHHIDDLVSDDHAFVLATITIDYLAEILWPGVVDVYARLTKIGNSSVHVEQVVAVEGQVRARAHSVMVLTDSTTRRPTPLPEAAKERLAQLM